MIADHDIDKALDYLRISAQDAAQARATVKYLAEFLKSKRAQLKLMQTGLSNAAADDVALAHPEYLELLRNYETAVEQDSKHSFKRVAALATIEAWRTMCSNQRAEGKAYG